MNVVVSVASARPCEDCSEPGGHFRTVIQDAANVGVSCFSGYVDEWAHICVSVAKYTAKKAAKTTAFPADW